MKENIEYIYLQLFQTELQDSVVKISKEASKVPDWLSCTKTMIPDFVAKDPKVTTFQTECNSCLSIYFEQKMQITFSFFHNQLPTYFYYMLHVKGLFESMHAMFQPNIFNKTK